MTRDFHAPNTSSPHDSLSLAGDFVERPQPQPLPTTSGEGDGRKVGDTPFVTVVILNWNGRRLLPPCLQALAGTDYPAGAWEVVVVDNASTDDSVAWVEANHPWVRIRRNPANWGFGKGNNPALRDAPGPFVVLLNSDTQVHSGWLRAMVATMATDPAIGAVTAKLLFPRDGARAGLVQNAGGMILPDGSGRDRGTVVIDGRVEHHPDDGRYDVAEEVFFFCGAGAMVRTTALADVGFFDERYFMYYEDLDLSWRLRLRGWKVVFAPEAVIEHAHAASSGEWSPLFTYNVERNRPLMLLKLAPWSLAGAVVASYVATFASNVARVLYWAMRHRQRGPHAARARMGARVILSWLWDLPAVIQDRRAIRARQLVDDREIRAWTRDTGSRQALAARPRPPSASQSPDPPQAPQSAESACIQSATTWPPVHGAGRREETVGIYNQFLATMGGGERHMGMAASVLAQAGYKVELITHVPVSVDRLAARFGLNLDGVSVKTIPLLPFDQLGEMTATYDLFLNASFMSCLPSAARHSLLLVLFPFPLDRSPIGRFKAWVGARLHRQLLIPRYGTGFFGPQELAGNRYRFTAGNGQVILETPWPGKMLRVRLVIGSFRPAGNEAIPVSITAGEGKQAFVVWDGSVATTPGNYQTIDVEVPGHLTRRGSVAITITSPVYRPYELIGTTDLTGVSPVVDPDDFRELGVAVARVMVRHPRHYLYEVLFERLIPELARRLHGLPDPRAMTYLRTYNAVLPISLFTDRWLERYWDVRGTAILYPPVEVTQVVPRPVRDRIILGVGRFFTGSHNKKHDEMIRTFRDLVEARSLVGWELHLVGGSMPEVRHQTYLQKCRTLAAGLPVVFHVDASAPVLHDLYARAAIFWHATGFGQHEDRDPILFEHFGITTVEAMAAGCVPVVIGRGAQSEIVDDGRSGFTWTSRAEWKACTLAVARDDALATRLRRGAIARSRDFGEDVFRDHLLRIVETVRSREGTAHSVGDVVA